MSFDFHCDFIVTTSESNIRLSEQKGVLFITQSKEIQMLCQTHEVQAYANPVIHVEQGSQVCLTTVPLH